MKVFRIFLSGLILSAIILGGGCEQIDKLAAGTKEATKQGQVVLDSPAGELLPPGIRIALESAGALAAALAVAWQQWRLNNMTTTTKSIVKGVELAQKQENPQTANVKENIKMVMKLAGDYDRQNKIVDKLKIS